MTECEVGVVGVNWKQPSLTAECVRSIEKSENARISVIVVDNGSGDDSLKLLKENCPRALLLENEHNLGYAGGCNRGIQEALRQGCAFVFLLNNDAVVAPNTVALLLEHMEGKPDIGICGPMIMWHDRQGLIQILGARFSPKTGLFHAVGVNEKDVGQYKGPIEFDMVSGCALMIRREVFERIGQFDERFFCYFEEADLCFRARKAGYKVIAVPQSKVFHKNAFSSGGASSPSRIYYSVRNHLLFLEKNEPSGSLLSRWFKSLLVVANYMIFVVLGSDVPKSKGIRACFAGFKDYLHSKFGPLKL